MQQVSIVSNLPAFAYKEQIWCWKTTVLFKSWLRKTRCFTANVNRSEYFELGHSDRFYHTRAVRDLSTFVTKSYETCPVYIKVTNSSILLHTSLAGCFRKALNQKCCKDSRNTHTRKCQCVTCHLTPPYPGDISGSKRFIDQSLF